MHCVKSLLAASALVLAAMPALAQPGTGSGTLSNDFPYAQNLGVLDAPRNGGAGPMDQFSYFPFYQERFNLNPGTPAYNETFLKFTTRSPRAFGAAQITEAGGKAVQVRWYDLSQNQISNCTNECTLTPGTYYLRITPAQGRSPQGYAITATIHALPADTFVYGGANENAALPVGSVLSPGQAGSFSGALYAVLQRGAPIAGSLTLPVANGYSTDYHTQYFSISTQGGPVRLSLSGQVGSFLYLANAPFATWVGVPADGVVQNYAQPLKLWLTTDATSGSMGFGAPSDFYEPFTVGFQDLSSGNAGGSNPGAAPQPIPGYTRPPGYTGPVYCTLPPSQQQNCPPGTIY
jgi:hypothetical protein